MGTMVYSLFWVIQDLYHEPWGSFSRGWQEEAET